MYYVVKVDGWFTAAIDKTGKPNKYGQPKYFNRLLDAQNWIARRTYPGMSWHYEIRERV